MTRGLLDNTYRQDIDGLRAVAVLLVIVTHISPTLLPGGFVGVDVFFVISGFLITQIIYRQISTGTFSLLVFWERRARRLLPALICVIFITSLFGFLILPPRALIDLGQSIVASTLFASNILFYIETGYFDTAAKLKPLLHTWSLGIEEQFYLIFPLFLMTVYKLGRQYIFPASLTLVLVSLGASQYYLTENRDISFYFLPFRAWELLLGGCLGLLMINGRNGFSAKGRSYLALLGLVGICLSAFLFDESSPLPGLLSLVPVVSTLVVIYASPGSGFAYYLLTCQPMVYLGAISYGGYLWHFPILSLLRNVHGIELGLVLSVASFICTLFMASVSYRYLETPFRDAKRLSRSRALGAIFVGCTLCILIGFGFHWSKGYPNRADFSPQLMASMSKPERITGCFDIDFSHSSENWGCVLGKKKQSIDIILMGDSHALSMLNLIDGLAHQKNLSVFFAGYSGCIPLPELTPFRADQRSRNCAALNSRLYELAKKSKPIAIILVARWSHYYYESDSRSPQLFAQTSSIYPRSVMSSNLALIEGGLDRIREKYLDKDQLVYIFTEVPTQDFSPQQIYFKSRTRQASVTALSVGLESHLKSTLPFDSLLKRRPNLKKVDLTSVVCSENKCPVGTQDQSYYYDNNHLSEVGVQRLEPLMTEVFREIVITKN
jgi:peptidoglycan/LPS O-acetylase OafA/YrhL